jgi:hypothetical protein
LNKPTVNHSFIDSLRFIAMIGIIMEHSSFFFDIQFNTIPEKIVQISTLQVFKSGTIIFFLLAGFLIGDKFNAYNTVDYLKRRVNNTAKPWLFWVVILLILNYINKLVIVLKSNETLFTEFTFRQLATDIGNIVFNTSFWFIPNFLLCIAILLCFRKYLYSMVFGFILLCLSLVYSINLYLDIFPTSHTIAFFGFIFYLWLGVQLNKHFVKFEAFIKKTSIEKLGFLLLTTFILASLESYSLLTLLPADPFNTLRITNILYSLASFCFLYKLGNRISMEWFNPRRYTFGLYLIHQILIFRLMPAIFSPLHINFIDKSAYYYFAVQCLTFAIVYSTSILLVWLIDKSARLRWIIGR